MAMKAYACPRCLTLSSECEDGDGGAHTCTPTPLARGLEEERDRYRAALSDMSDELSHYPEGNGIFGHLKRILRRALA